MDHPKLQVVYNLTGSRIQGGVSAYNLIGSRTRGYKPSTTSLDPESKGVYWPTTLSDPEPEGASHLRPYWIQNPKVHKLPATSLGPEPDTQDKYTTRPELLRAVTTTYSAEAEHVARLLLASGP
jgi:hypothetical protein